MRLFGIFASGFGRKAVGLHEFSSQDTFPCSAGAFFFSLCFLDLATRFFRYSVFFAAFNQRVFLREGLGCFFRFFNLRLALFLIYLRLFFGFFSRYFRFFLIYLRLLQSFSFRFYPVYFFLAGLYFRKFFRLYFLKFFLLCFEYCLFLSCEFCFFGELFRRLFFLERQDIKP